MADRRRREAVGEPVVYGTLRTPWGKLWVVASRRGLVALSFGHRPAGRLAESLARRVPVVFVRDPEGLLEYEQALSRFLEGRTSRLSLALDRLGHRKLPGYAQLTSEQKERLRLLYRWRFEKATEINRACFMLLPDPQLVALARLKTASLQTMAGRGLLSVESAHRFGPEILTILQQD